MIFIQGYGNKNYSKLNEVMNLDKKEKQENQDGFEKLTQVVDENYKTFSSHMKYNREKHPRTNLKTTVSSFKPQCKQDFKMNKVGLTHTATSFKVKENSLEEKFISKFKNAVRIKDSNEILNYEKCVKIIDENVLIHQRYPKEIKTFFKKGDQETRRREETVEITNEKEIGSNEIKEKEPETKEVTVKQPNRKPSEIFKRNDPIKNRPINERRVYIKKLVGILQSVLIELFENHIPISHLFNDNPFPKTPFSKSKSKEFFNEVKLGNDKRVKELLMLDRFLIFEYDHFRQTGYHWAAKRGLKSTLELLISYGNHINLLDINRRTPLFLASKNNHIEIVKFLLEKGSNPNIINSYNKKAIDVCTDENIKRILKVNMDSTGIVIKLVDVLNFHKNGKVELNKKPQESD